MSNQQQKPGATKTVKRIVTHPKFYYCVGGKLQHIKLGTELILSESEAERLEKGGRVADKQKSVVVADDKG